MMRFTTTATIGTRELAITYDGADDVDVTCVCGTPLNLGPDELMNCPVCGALWETESRIHSEAYGATSFTLRVLQNEREVAVFTNQEPL